MSHRGQYNRQTSQNKAQPAKCQASESRPAPPKPPKVLRSGLSSLEKEQIRSPPAIPAPIIPIAATFCNKCRAVSQKVWAGTRLNHFLRINHVLLCLQTAADCTLCECVRWAIVGKKKQREGGGVIKCVTYVPFILIPSKEPRLIKLTSDAPAFPLINGCRNHTKIHGGTRRGGYHHLAQSTCHRDGYSTYGWGSPFLRRCEVSLLPAAVWAAH